MTLFQQKNFYSNRTTRERREESSRVGFYQKDYFFSLKVSPLKEGKYYPAIAVGGNDPSRSIN